MWHVSSRSGVATLRTAIHLLLTYLLTVFAAQECGQALFSRRRMATEGGVVAYISVTLSRSDSIHTARAKPCIVLYTLV